MVLLALHCRSGRCCPCCAVGVRCRSRCVAGLNPDAVATEKSELIAKALELRQSTLGGSSPTDETVQASEPASGSAEKAPADSELQDECQPGDPDCVEVEVPIVGGKQSCDADLEDCEADIDEDDDDEEWEECYEGDEGCEVL